MMAAVFCSVLVSLMVFNQVLTNPYAGGHNHNNNQWSNPRAGMGGYQPQQQQHGFGGYNGGGGQQGFGNNFGQGGGGGGYSQNRGRPQWQSGGNGQGAEAYHTNVFNEPDRYGYDYTIPGATVHYLMHKKQGNRGSGNYGGNGGGWNQNY